MSSLKKKLYQFTNWEFDIERKIWFTFNFNEIIYYTIEKVGEENV